MFVMSAASSMSVVSQVSEVSEVFIYEQCLRCLQYL